jgi:hypothetical protein
MTGQKDRYSTQEKLWKLDDEQLTTPKHDEMVLKILSNGEHIFNKYKTQQRHDSQLIINNYRRNQKKKFEFSSYDNASIDIENCLLKQTGYGYNEPWEKATHEFTDMSTIKNTAKDITTNYYVKPNVLSEVPLKAKNGFLIGFLDILLSCPHTKENFILSEYASNDYKHELTLIVTAYENKIGIEVKPTIPSFGQTLRQLNTYREYFTGKLMLCTADLRFKDAFESQGIQIISPADICGVSL